VYGIIINHTVACRAVAMQRSPEGGYTRAVSGQRFGKDLPVKQATQQLPLLGNARNIHGRNNRRTVFSVWSVPKYNREVWSLVS
jgi:hypothetical protein